MDQSSDRRRFLAHGISASLYATPLMGLLLNACKSTGRVAVDTDLQSTGPTTGGLQNDQIAVKSLRLSATDPLNKKNLQLYAKAVGAMKATTFPLPLNGDTVTWWEAHADIHANFCPHGNWYFLPWHRAYLHFFELVCREFSEDQSFALPYWDWSSDSRLPEEFDEGDEKSNPLCNETRSTARRQALDIEEVSAQNVAQIMATLDFEEFGGSPSHHPRPREQKDQHGYSGTLEAGPHNRVHATIQGDMGAYVSPRDPIFWLHHCNIDRLWEAWRAQVMLNNGEALPADVRKADGILDEALDAQFPGRSYWKNHALEGFYNITKVGDKYEAAPAQMLVKDVVEAASLGLVYQSPKPPEATPEPAPVPTQAAIPGVDIVTEPQTIDPQTTVVPTEASKKTSVQRWRKAIRKTILIRTKAVKSFGLAQVPSGVIGIEASPDLEVVLKNAASRNWNGASLRLKIDRIPSPSDPKAQLQFYLNATTASGKRQNPSFIGAMSFFGHNHDSSGIATILNLLPAVKALAKVGRAPFGQKNPQALTITAVWDRSTATEDLSDLSFRLDYLEYRL